MGFQPFTFRKLLLGSGLLFAAALLGCLGGDDKVPVTGGSNRGHFTVLNPGPGGMVDLDTVSLLIRWRNDDVTPPIPANVRIELYQGDSLLLVLVTSAPNNDSYVWNVANTRLSSGYRFGSGNNYRLKLTNVSDTSEWDFSGTFSVYSDLSGTIQVTLPTATTNVLLGQSLNIQWQASLYNLGGGTLTQYILQLYKDTVLVSTISASVTGLVSGTVLYTWPSVATTRGTGNDYLVRVFSAMNPALQDFSERFTIRSQYQGTISLTSPVVGDTLRIGSVDTVAWDTTGNPGITATIQLYRNDTLVYTVTSVATVGLRSYPWSVPTLPASDRYRVRIVSNQDGNNADTSGYFVLGAFPPAVPVLVSPANGDTGQSTSPNLVWGASAGTTSYRLQVATDAGFTTGLLDFPGLTAIFRAVTGLSPSTVYYWRVNASNVNGASAWSAVWSFTTGVNPPPSAPVLLSPSQAATGASTSLMLSWTASGGATSYGLQLATDSLFTIGLLNYSGIVGTSRSMSGLVGGTQYYWRVNATNANGTGPWSTVWNFTTGLPPSAPTLLSPLNGAASQPTSPTLSWNSVAGTTFYTVQLATDTSFSAPISSNPSATSQSFSGLSGSTTYYWRVSAVNGFGTSAWSPVWSFVTASGPVGDSYEIDSTYLLSNLITANGPAQSHTLHVVGDQDWLAFDAISGDTYTLTVSSNFDSYLELYNMNGTSLLTSADDIIGADAQITWVFTTSGRYYFKVRAFGNVYTGAYTITVTRATAGVPSAPTLMSPFNGSSGEDPADTWFDWSDPSGTATSFALQVSTNASFTSMVVNQSGIPNPFYNATALSGATTYYWRVSASNGSGTGPWSQVWSFSTSGGTVPPAIPIPISPANGSTGNPTSLYLAWDSANTTFDTYHLQVSTSIVFSSLTLDTLINGNQWGSVDGLTPGVQYYFRVNAANGSGTSAWSSTWNFTTAAGNPTPQIMFSSPRNGATGVLSSEIAGVVFNMPMDSASVVAALSISPAPSGGRPFFFRDAQGDGLIDVVYWLDSATFSSGLAVNTRYTVTVAATASSPVGVTMAAPYTFSFTTGPTAPAAKASASGSGIAGSFIRGLRSRRE